MLPFQQLFDKVYDAHLSGKTAFFNVGIGDYMCKLLLAPGASPQTPPGGLFLPPGPPPPAWVDASHGHGLGHQKNSIQLLVPDPSLRPSSGSRGRLWNGLHDVTTPASHSSWMSISRRHRAPLQNGFKKALVRALTMLAGQPNRLAMLSLNCLVNLSTVTTTVTSTTVTHLWHSVELLGRTETYEGCADIT